MIATGPTQIKSTPLKSSSGELIIDKGNQMDRWKKLCTDQYTKPSVVFVSAHATIEQLGVLHKLDEMLTISVLSNAIDKLAFGKAPGSDVIPPDLIKQCQTVFFKPI